MFRRAMLPIVACTTFGFNASAVPAVQTMLRMPNQSAVRMMVPRLPGSCTLSSARTSSAAGASERLADDTVGISNIPSTCCGCWSSDTLRSSSSVTGISSAVAGRLTGLCHAAVCTTMRGRKPAHSRSSTHLGPSARKAFSFLRNFFCSRERINFIFDLLSIFR